MSSAADLIRARYGALPFDPPNELAPGLAAVLDRRVTRRYRPEPVAPPLLQTLLAAAQSAPSKSDLQQYSIIVLQDPAKIAAIADWIGSMPWIKQAPIFLLFCGDIRRGQRLCEIAGREHANNNIDTFINATADAALAMAHMILAAEGAGLGTCPISYVRNHVEKIGPMCRLPKGVFPVAGLTLGWPEARNEPSPRLPQGVVVHHETYDDAGLAAALPGYDALRLPGKPRYPEILGPVPAGCSWSENSARQLSVPERMGLSVWLKGRGVDLA